jgi:hypothetical protein
VTNTLYDTSLIYLFTNGMFKENIISSDMTSNEDILIALYKMQKEVVVAYS